MDSLNQFVRDYYRTKDLIPLHAPEFSGRESDLVLDAINSTFVSSVGAYVDQFEQDICNVIGSEAAVTTVNGTAALHLGLVVAGVVREDLVITQALTFVATCNAINYCGAAPVFIDVDNDSLGLSATALELWLTENAVKCPEGSAPTHGGTGRPIRACVPMHCFGHIGDIETLAEVCDEWGIVLVEDAAEALGSKRNGQHAGTIGRIGVLSFNGNKIITTGGGGMLIGSTEDATKAKHLSTTAKLPHPYEYVHDQVGFNYRMPNLNAALGCGQLERLGEILAEKRSLAMRYRDFFSGTAFRFFEEPAGCESNYWLNAVICESTAQRDVLLKSTNDAGVMTRPVWKLMSELPMYSNSLRGNLSQSEHFAKTVVNLPSSPMLGVSK